MYLNFDAKVNGFSCSIVPLSPYDAILNSERNVKIYVILCRRLALIVLSLYWICALITGTAWLEAGSFRKVHRRGTENRNWRENIRPATILKRAQSRPTAPISEIRASKAQGNQGHQQEAYTATAVLLCFYNKLV